MQPVTMHPRKTLVLLVTFALVGGAGYLAGAHAQKKPRFFELRTYVASPGKIDALHARFRDHTRKLFAKHGMENVGYWTPTTGEDADRTLVYLLAYPSQEAREAAWKAFKEDPVWVKVKAASEKDGTKLAAKVTSVFLTPTDYSSTK